MAEQKKAVLMVHIDQYQGQLWQAALETQQLEVTWESPNCDLVQYLEQCDRQNLPNLLLMDIALKSPNSETLQSSSVCQWVKKQQSDTKVVLFNPRQERIKDIEHSWALRRGAVDVLPRLSRDNLISEIARVTALIGCSLIAHPLEAIAISMDGVSTVAQEKTVAVTPVEAINVNSKSDITNKPKVDTKSDTAIMYRGVRIRR
ncbi:response regulator [Pseudanabaena yagii]|uniref:Response regulator n=1 Tax=Pseudanabaena yagii GIHE-NHR1 TaxID=2722753 RepID=A0ABX1LPT2_9CYAN|nr:response regulator [Pseudanabaena yagii]NMF57520.1 response regulator [Pseudanabaena yagii GIHE-NHR1]